MRKCLREKCGKEFEPARAKSKFCSDSCRVYHHRESKSKQQESEAISFNEKTIERLAEILAGKMNIQSATVKIIEGKPVASFQVDMEDLHPKKSYNDYLEIVAKARSIEECVALDSEISKSGLEGWKKTELSKRIKQRSQHPDLN